MKLQAPLLAFALGLVLFFGSAAIAQQPAGLTVYFYRDGQAVAVTRPGLLGGDVQGDTARLLAELLSGPNPAEQAAGLLSALPPEAELAAVATSGDEVTVDLWLPPAFLRSQLDPERNDAVVQQIVKTLHPLGLHRVLVRAAESGGQEKGFVPLAGFMPRPAVPAPVTITAGIVAQPRILLPSCAIHSLYLPPLLKQ